MTKHHFIFRRATLHDLSEILRLLADDELGSTRETISTVKIDPCYRAAFEEIDSDRNQALMVVEENNKIIGTCHLTYMPSLTFQGAKRLNIEAVRIEQTFRNLGIGEWMIQQALQTAKDHGCKIVQLATNKKRSRAKIFYEKLGFEATHEGMKLYFPTLEATS